MAESSKFAYYIAGMDQNTDLIQGAVDCLRDRAGAKANIYVGIEESNIKIKDAILVHTAKGKQWTGRARDHLSQIKHDYLVFLLEDYFILEVNEAKIEKLVDQMLRFNAGCIKLLPAPRPNKGVPGRVDLGFYEDHEIGRINTQPALWAKDYLESLLFEDESLWEFEINSGIRSIKSEKNSLGLYAPALKYNEVVKRGKFRRRYKSRYKTEMNKYDIEKNRGLLNLFDEVIFEASHHFSQILKHVTTQHFRSLIKHLIKR